MALSTWMRKVAVWRVLTTSSGSSCWRLARNGGTLHSTPSGRQSWGWSHSQPWLCLLAAAFQVGHFSLSAPCLKYSHHKLLIQTTVHSVCIQLAASTCFCYYNTNRLHLAPLGWNLDGFAIGNSVELTLTSSWILFLEGGRGFGAFLSAWLGQMLTSLNECDMQRTRARNIRETVVWPTPKQAARSGSGKPCRNLHSVSNNSSSRESFLFRPRPMLSRPQWSGSRSDL